MGLDMYLKAKVYLQFYTGDDTNNNKKRAQIINNIFGIENPDCDFGVDNIVFDVAYWRKANAIHNWFVQNVQDGVDDCREESVSQAQLQLLVDDCKRVIANPALGPGLLPSLGGCLFGSTEYDEGYFQDLKDTIEQVERAFDIAGLKGAHFYYHSSW